MDRIAELREAIKVRSPNVVDMLSEFVKERGNGPTTWGIYDHLYGYSCLMGNTDAMDFLVCNGATNLSWSNINAFSSEVYKQRLIVKEKILDGCEGV
jgi:hypothetical protein